MSPLEYSCELDPISDTTLQIQLLRNVDNLEEIRNNIVQGIWKCVVVKANMVLDPFQIVVAANKAVVSDKHNTMVTRTVFTELLYNLSLTKNITQSLSKFGIEKERDFLVCFLKTSDTDCKDEILSQIKGNRCPMTELTEISDRTKIKNAYKLDDWKKDSDMLDTIVSRMLTKNFVSH